MPRLSRSSWRSIAGAVLTILVVLVALWLQDSDGGSKGDAQQPSGAQSQAGGRVDKDMPAKDDNGYAYVAVSQLPEEAAETLALIDSGGPFPYPGKDGSTFRNGEGRLPRHDRGYYAEYTVPTPGEGDRGARRIIAGDGGELYWTGDHYDSFERIWR